MEGGGNVPALESRRLPARVDCWAEISQVVRFLPHPHLLAPSDPWTGGLYCGVGSRWYRKEGEVRF